MLIAALRKHAGVFVLAARELGCQRHNVSQRVGRSVQLQAVCAEIKAEIGDVAKSVIYDALLKKDKPMARWYAERQLRDEGFGNTTALTDPNGNPLQLAGPTNVTIVTQYVTPADQVEDVV